jgi:predicted O-methyltransferase YrrM
MSGHFQIQPPAHLTPILAATSAIGFTMGSDALTGSLLRTLAASKPGGNLLEIGTGTGLSAAWLLDGMDENACLTSVDQDEQALRVARTHLGGDSRSTFLLTEGTEFLSGWRGAPFDLIFADAWPGKFTHLELALGLLGPGGLYVIDDLLPQPNWPAGHQTKVDALLEKLAARTDLTRSWLHWSTGLLIGAKSVEA